MKKKNAGTLKKNEGKKIPSRQKEGKSLAWLLFVAALLNLYDLAATFYGGGGWG